MVGGLDQIVGVVVTAALLFMVTVRQVFGATSSVFGANLAGFASNSRPMALTELIRSLSLHLALAAQQVLLLMTSGFQFLTTWLQTAPARWQRVMRLLALPPPLCALSRETAFAFAEVRDRGIRQRQI